MRVRRQIIRSLRGMKAAASRARFDERMGSVLPAATSAATTTKQRRPLPATPSGRDGNHDGATAEQPYLGTGYKPGLSKEAPYIPRTFKGPF
jgi:hypothetical protein